MFEKLFGKESGSQKMPEAFKDVDLIMQQLDARVLEKNDESITYEIDEDISGSALFTSLKSEHPDLTIESTDGMYGKYEVTVALKETVSAPNEEEMV